TAAVCGLTLAATVGLWPASAPRAAAQPPAKPKPATAAKPAPPREGVIIITSFQEGPPAQFLTPDGTVVRTLMVENAGAAASPVNPGGPPVCPLWLPRLSPDGKRLIAVRLGPIPQNLNSPWTPNHLWVFDVDSDTGPTAPLLADIRWPSAIWSRDGKTVYGSNINPNRAADPVPADGPLPLVCWALDPKTKVRTPLALPPGHQIMDLSPDGTTLLTTRIVAPLTTLADETYLVPLNTLTPKRLTDKPFHGMRFSPDGKRVLGKRVEESKARPLIVSVADRSETVVRVPDKATAVYHACWSPDGRRVAYVWEEDVDPPAGAPILADGDQPRFHASRLAVADADGKNEKTILRREHNQPIYGVDWK
ncbi:MAG: hypothetical protein U0871_14125, partial [Gemmataceae bacterium]